VTPVLGSSRWDLPFQPVETTRKSRFAAIGGVW
jgi:hypothetical protein